MAATEPLDCIAPAPADPGRPIHAVTPAACEAFLQGLPPEAAHFLAAQQFRAESGRLLLLPGAHGVAGAVLGLGDAPDLAAYGSLASSLPPGVWHFAASPGEEAVLGFCLGAYRQRRGTQPGVRLALTAAQTAAHAATLELACAISMVRDLINRPPNLLGPEELAAAAARCGRQHGAVVEIVAGDRLGHDYPAVAAVGAGSARRPRVVTLRWQGSAATVASPLVALCGKGVCFDTGGYDLKPSNAMLHMKKDMGGAALALGLARLIMHADLPLRLALWIGCVENSVSGTAMRPSDVIATRSGLVVEVGNTDAEGRLVLCDLLAAACEQNPSLLLDFATLTGAARIALGPDLPALFSNQPALAAKLLAAAGDSGDPLWQLPLWQPYRDGLKSPCADLSTVASKPLAGAIVAALFLQSFVKDTIAWAHIDAYCWNDHARPGRPEGGEASGLRAVWRMLRDFARTADLP